MEDHKPWACFGTEPEFCEKEKIWTKSFPEMPESGDAVDKLVSFKRITDKDLGVKLPAADQFFGKNSYFNAFLDEILHVFRAIWKNTIFKIWKPVEKIKLSLSSLSFTFRSSPKHA